MDNPKCIYAGNPDQGRPWIFIPDTAEAKAKAIEEGYSAFSTMSFDYAPEKGKPEPTRYGSLWMDIDCKEDPKRSISIAQKIIFYLETRYKVNPRSLRYFLSGGKGMHLEIPAATYGGKEGHPYLPQIQKVMLTRTFKIPLASIDGGCLDTQLYSGGKGKLLRAPNILRPDGKYKVEISYEELMSLPKDELILLTCQPRTTSIDTAAPNITDMSYWYDAAMAIETLLRQGKQSKEAINAILECSFIEHCWENQDTLSEPEWFRMVGIFMSLGNVARPIIHEFSLGYPGYSYQETENKIAQAKCADRKITCEYIQEVYQCNRKCNVRSPGDMFFKNKANREIVATSFQLRDTGVFYTPNDGQENDGIYICSPLKILGKMRNSSGVGWARLVEFTAPDGQRKQLPINMRDCTGRGELVRSILSDHGLEIAMYPKANSLLMEYIQYGAPEDTIYLQLDKVGWHEATYVLPDEQFGASLSEKIYLAETTDTLHNISGDLQLWQERIGKLCAGNSLLVLATSYALTGPLLRPCDMEGGGLHIYGASSTGKTTLALVAGSVCGGGGNRGYLRQWRSTHNALEHTAAMHNDNLLVLDEVGQATAEVVSQVAYMLPNGQGRSRMRADASLRDPLTWRLNFLSTGELTINDKIEESGKQRAMAGQAVRIIDLPIDGGTGENMFANLHEHADPASLSVALADVCSNSYGTALRAFIAKYCEGSEQNQESLLKKIDEFVSLNVSSDASGQVRRVARKFGLIASAGEAAIEWGILPFSKGEAYASAQRWFKIWLEQRGGSGDLEMAKVLKRIQDHFALNQSQYVRWDRHASLVDNNLSQPNMWGYRIKDGGEELFIMLTPRVDEIARGVNRKCLLGVLKAKGWVVCDASGKVRETHSIGGKNKRGIAFIPARWDEVSKSGSSSLSL